MRTTYKPAAFTSTFGGVDLRVRFQQTQRGEQLDEGREQLKRLLAELRGRDQAPN
jgi:hypothetical protein